MNKKDITLIAIIVIIAVIASNITMLYILRTIPFIHSNDFIAIAVALIGIMVTFAIGYQIFTTLDIRQQTSKINEINDLKTELEGLCLKVEIENCISSANQKKPHEFSEAVTKVVELYCALALRIRFNKYLKDTDIIHTITFTYSEYKPIEHYEYLLLEAYLFFLENVCTYSLQIPDLSNPFEVIPNIMNVRKDLQCNNHIIQHLVFLNTECKSIVKKDIDRVEISNQIGLIYNRLRIYINHYKETNKTLLFIN